MTICYIYGDYLPGSPLDGELATLGYAGMCGWPDQRPVTASLVRSRLRPLADGPPTLLALARNGEELVGAAALRQARPGVRGRLWGPVVAHAYRRRGVGTRLLELLCPPGHEREIASAEVPELRAGAHHFFQRHAWQVATEARLFKKGLDDTLTAEGPACALADHGSLQQWAPAVGELASLCWPHQPRDHTEATLARWSADERFTPEGVLVCGSPERVEVAMLLYPLAPANPPEPPEVLLGDVLVHPSTSRGVTAAVLRQALRTARLLDAQVMRAVVSETQPATTRLLTEAGFTSLGRLSCYAPPVYRV